jgi:hypothetical protein
VEKRRVRGALPAKLVEYPNISRREICFRKKWDSILLSPFFRSGAWIARDYQGVIEQAYQLQLGLDLEFLSDRDADLWIPLFAICSVCVPDRLLELKQCAVILSGAKAGDDAEDSLPLKLLGDIKVIWPEGQEKCDTATLLEKLKTQEESPWAEYGLSPCKVAKMLRPFGVESRSVRIGAKTPKGYSYDSFKSAFERYLGD